MRPALLATLLTSLVCACAHEPEPESSAGPESIVARLERMHADDPADGAATWALARFALSEGDEERALVLLTELAALPAWDLPLLAEDFAAVADDPRFVALAERIQARAPTREHGPIAFELERGGCERRYGTEPAGPLVPMRHRHGLRSSLACRRRAGRQWRRQRRPDLAQCDDG